MNARAPELHQADAELVFPAWTDRYARGWPAHDDGVAAHVPAWDLFSRGYAFDAHFAAYLHPLERRLTCDALSRVTEPPRMVALVVDVDAPGHVAPPAWREELRTQARRLPGRPFVYFTRGGARIVYRLAEPFAVTGEDAARAWSRFYVRALVQLACLTGIVGDPKCRDWTHLFRAPHATRDGALEAHGWASGHPTEIGPLPELDVDAADAISLAASLSARSEPWRQALVHVLPPLPAPPPAPVRWLVPRGASKALAYADRKVRDAGKGARNGTLYASARWLGELAAAGEVDRAEAARVLVAAGVAAGLPAAEVRRTVDSALRAAR